MPDADLCRGSLIVSINSDDSVTVAIECEFDTTLFHPTKDYEKVLKFINALTEFSNIGT
jgi:hypothetical protein